MGGRIQHIQLGGPMLIKEIVIASVLAFAAGGTFKMWHWDMQKRSKNFYHQLDRGPPAASNRKIQEREHAAKNLRPVKPRIMTPPGQRRSPLFSATVVRFERQQLQ
ncbi:hypothetical protein H5410_051546 [Solanum commersonii]|uniref:Uncharacterized protein n=1 Tax=Solanum commersonii TaxID=4109 RepID=A0A9J5WZU3_SOLCO|nr:hypothetical protein H5410_051546 [Solanum commersonii]